MEKISQNAVCPLADCPQCSKCLRHFNYQQLSSTAPSYTVVNTSLITPDAEGCPYLLVKQYQRIAYGFERLRDAVPRKQLPTLFTRAGFGSRASFDRRWHGHPKYGLNPAEQQRILGIFQSLGVDPSIGFDRYQEEEVVVERAD
ncbi:MAG: hypothetical protein IJ845_07275 [Bacteroidaceae bacterium]|nr:hypothetical protein [Bacteroidaceae bacterium]